jgi:hypothetical protein
MQRYAIPHISGQKPFIGCDTLRTVPRYQTVECRRRVQDCRPIWGRFDIDVPEELLERRVIRGVASKHVGSRRQWLVEL